MLKVSVTYNRPDNILVQDKYKPLVEACRTMAHFTPEMEQLHNELMADITHATGVHIGMGEGEIFSAEIDGITVIEL